MKKKIIIGAFALGLGIFAFTTQANATNHLQSFDDNTTWHAGPGWETQCPTGGSGCIEA